MDEIIETNLRLIESYRSRFNQGIADSVLSDTIKYGENKKSILKKIGELETMDDHFSFAETRGMGIEEFINKMEERKNVI